jgi:DNA-binding response OmpR family regulator
MDTSRRPHILLVDDDISTIQVLWCLLSDEAQIRFARSAAQALELARERTPDLILLDLELPDGHGLELCRALRREPAALAQVPVLIVTAHAGDEQQVAALELGAADFIRKPLQGPQLLARVHAQLRTRQAAPPMQTQFQAQPQPPAPTPPRPLRVLIVDDDVVAIKMLRNALEALSVQFHFATRGEEALRLAAQVRPDIILLDAQLPGLDGFEVCRRLKADATLAATPVIFVTRSDDPITEAMALDAGAVDFIGKPYRPAVLKARVQHALRPSTALADTPADTACAAGHPAARQLAALAEAQPDALLLLDPAGRIEWLNGAARRLLGLGAETGAGQPAETLWRAVQRLDRPPGTPPAWPPTPDGLPQPWRLTRLDGDLQDLRVTCRTHACAGEPLRSLLLQAAPPTVATDLDDEAPSKLLTLQRLVALARDGAEALAQPGGPANATTLREAAQHQARLLRDIDDLLGLAPDLPAVQCAAVDLGHCLRAAWAATGRPAPARGDLPADLSTDLSTELPADLPPVASDPTRLQRCLQRLLSSASAAAGAGAPRLRLTVTSEGDRVCLALSAAGWDWTPAQLRRLRWPLPDTEVPPAPVDQTALGLAVTHHLLTALGAEVQLDAGPPGGSPTFQVRLPCWGAQAAEPALPLPD